MDEAIAVETLRKSYGKVKALDDLCLNVQEGAVHALLGPNAAGKTTLVRILATLLRPDSGSASVFGVDVTRAPDQVRAMIALTGQRIATDDLLTGRENLELIGRLRRLSGVSARRRAAELIQDFELADAADRPVKTYSGGMSRRLDLALSFVSRPRLLFLDEPTTALDPHSRHALWSYIQRFAREAGTTVVLTTQYLEEADRLADQISVLDRGKTIAEGTPEQLKARASGHRVELTLASHDDLARAERVLAQYGHGAIESDRLARTIRAPIANPVGILPRLVEELGQAHVQVADLVLRRPTLDDAFLAITGQRPAPAALQPSTPGTV